VGQLYSPHFVVSCCTLGSAKYLSSPFSDAICCYVFIVSFLAKIFPSAAQSDIFVSEGVEGRDGVGGQ
jgi:hypothetical protein